MTTKQLATLEQSGPASLPVLPRPEYSVVIRRFNAWAEGRPVTEETVREFFKAQIKAGYSARSIELAKVALKAAIYAATPVHDLRVRAAMDSLFRSIKIPKPENKLQSKDLFSREEIKKIANILNAEGTVWASFFVRCLYNTGARVSELLSVRIADCRADKDKMLCPILGKGSKERVLIIDVATFEKVKKLCNSQVYLFESRPGKAYNRRTVFRTLKWASMAATGRHMHPHSLRHSRISHLLASGESVDAVSRFAGHSKPSITLNYYAHNTVSPETIVRTGL